ncbi:MAG: hypothetical protein ACE5JS_00575 [Nitrospinota bacterium]
MKGSRVLTILCCLGVFLAMSLEAQAASARARCRVRDDRVRVQIDGRDLAPGLYTAKVTNLDTPAMAATEPGKDVEATALRPDVDLDFDSTADPDDADSSIADDFAAGGERVLAEVKAATDGSTVAMATTECRG